METGLKFASFFPFDAKFVSRLASYRWFAAALLGVALTSVLFWMMQYMILGNELGLTESRDIKMVEFVRLKRDTTYQPKKRRLPEIPPPTKRPPPPKMATRQTQVVENTVPDFDMPNLDIPLNSDRFKGPIVSGLSIGSAVQSTGEVIPLVRISPRYPMRAAMRHIEGWVKVEFTITSQGTVRDASVVDANPKHIFNQEALRAIAKWKFKPKLVDGIPVERRAAQTLEFKLRK